MNKFDTIESLVMVVIIFCIGIIILQVVSGSSENVTVGYNGIVEHRCISGMQFVVDQNGRAVQVMDQYGHGLVCK